MKGLMIKDFCFLRTQKHFFILVLVMTVFISITNGQEGNPATFVLPYLAFVSSFFVMITFSYDGNDNGNAFLFTLPFSRKTYVAEKYLFGILTGCVCVMAGFLWILIYLRATGAAKHTEETLFLAGVSMLIALLFISVMIPCMLKFGSERGRIVLGAVFIVVFIGAYGAEKWMEKGQIRMESISRLGQILGIWGVLAVMMAASAVLAVVSFAISTGILNRKEF